MFMVDVGKHTTHESYGIYSSKCVGYFKSFDSQWPAGYLHIYVS